ncbi:MAG: hypothetical protein CMF25_06420 [Kangiellaceae bacterium]|nr:hypothetical protein [Kangiellaceae bacterium]
MSSLKSRIVLIASLVILLFIVITGVIIERAYIAGLKADIREQAELHVYNLLAVAEPLSSKLWLPEELASPRFNQPGSGLVAAVGQAGNLWHSKSALGDNLPKLPSLQEGKSRFVELATKQQQWFVYSFGTTFVGTHANIAVTIHILESDHSYWQQLSSYRNQLWPWLMMLGILLLGVIWAGLWWGFLPLSQLSTQLDLVEQGQQDKVSGQYPKEFQRLTSHLNAFIESQAAQKQRHRQRLDDLAHTLKTPLAVLTAELNHAPKPIQDQLFRMNQVITHQLQRAVSGGPSPFRKNLPIEPLIQSLRDAMEKIYRDKNIDIKLKVAPGCVFNGEEADIMEVLGNLIDNACKACASKVCIEAVQSEKRLTIQIGDDGPGIPESASQHILNRGQRLDSYEQGQGIGLAMVAEMVEQYQGRLSLDTSPLGGALFRLEFD